LCATYFQPMISDFSRKVSHHTSVRLGCMKRDKQHALLWASSVKTWKIKLLSHKWRYYSFSPSVQEINFRHRPSIKDLEAVAVSTIVHNSCNNISMASVSAIFNVLASEWRGWYEAQNPNIILRPFHHDFRLCFISSSWRCRCGIFLHLHVQFAVTEDASIWNSSLATYTHAQKIIICICRSE
jgi:hypothetical protein